MALLLIYPIIGAICVALVHHQFNNNGALTYLPDRRLNKHFIGAYLPNHAKYL